MTTKTRATTIGTSQHAALSFIFSHPGVCTAEVDRACRTARNGHKWMYETVGRLIRRRMVTTVRNGSRADLYVTDFGCATLAVQ